MIDLSKKKRQLIQKLQYKKFRTQLGLFVVEGKKSISEFLKSNYEIHSVFCTENYWNLPNDKIFIVDKQQLNSLSFLKNPEQGVAIFYIPKTNAIKKSDIIIALDNVQDPGNLGTIIRLCDWFDIKQIICSEQTVDCFNPKVVQSTMGSLSRVCVVYTNLKSYLSKVDIPIYASVLSGENIYKTSLESKAILVMGNEANGISPEILKLCQYQITIPQFGKQQVQSLNVAMASAILISEFKRNI